MSINKFNIEGYDDPTAYEALTHINAEERKGRFQIGRASCRERV